MINTPDAPRSAVRWKLPVIATWIVGLILLAGCGGPSKGPAIGKLYNRSIQAGELDRNPVIVIPGVLGSKLKQRQTGVVVWGAFAGGYADPRSDDGARLMAIPMAEGETAPCPRRRGRGPSTSTG